MWDVDGLKNADSTSGHTMAFWPTQHHTKMSTRNISYGLNPVGG
jgi:hypothetical protein